jgi:hypothetical protein
MQTEQILALLIAERDKLSLAIQALQGPSKRRGRPPKNSVDGAVAALTSAPIKKRRTFSVAQRKAAAERMRQRWAAKRKTAAKTPKKSVQAAKAT